MAAMTSQSGRVPRGGTTNNTVNIIIDDIHLSIDTGAYMRECIKVHAYIVHNILILYIPVHIINNVYYWLLHGIKIVIHRILSI